MLYKGVWIGLIPCLRWHCLMMAYTHNMAENIVENMAESKP